MSDTHASSPDSNRMFFQRLWEWLLQRPHRYWRCGLLLVLALTTFRLWYANTLELVADEAYYRLWARHLDICYYSKGPGVAWTIALGTALGGDSVFGIRWPAVLLSAGTAIGLFQLARRLFSERTAFYTLLIAAVVPLFAIGSILMTIDPLSLFFWVWTALAFWHARQSRGLGGWILAGLLAGAGMLCKYTNGVQLLCFALFCALEPEDRAHFRRPGFWFMIGTAMLCLSPTLLWNQRYGWITVKHLLERGQLDKTASWTLKPLETTQFLSEQALAYSPLLLAALAAAVAIAARRGRKHLTASTFRPACLFLVCLTVPLFLFYVGLSLNEAGEANWTAPCYLSATLLAGALWTGELPAAPFWKRLLLAGWLLGLLQTLALHNTGLLPLARWGIPDPTDRARGARNLALQVHELQQTHGAALLIGRRYQTASLLSFYLPGRPTVYTPSSDRIEHQFSFWTGYRDFLTGETSALYVSDGSEGPPDSLRREFAEVRLIKETWSEHDGRRISPFRIYLCRSYLGPSPSSL
jgi:4-amino-4-deoxy-L-arabinose transferase-like glycosyltransferase